jgi:hypothetical protein
MPEVWPHLIDAIANLVGAGSLYTTDQADGSGRVDQP